jgi:hypothetical protein
MAKDVRDFLKGGSFFVQRGSKGVSKDMRAEWDIKASPNTGSVHGMLNYPTSDAYPSGRDMQEKYVPICRFGSSVAQIIDNSEAEPFW